MSSFQPDDYQKKKPSPHCVKYNFVLKEPKEDKSLSFFFFISLMSAVLHARTQHAAVREEIPKAPHNKPRNEKEAKVPLGRSFSSSSSSFSSFRFWSLGRSTPHTDTHVHTRTRRHGGRGGGGRRMLLLFLWLDYSGLDYKKNNNNICCCCCCCLYFIVF